MWNAVCSFDTNVFEQIYRGVTFNIDFLNFNIDFLNIASIKHNSLPYISIVLFVIGVLDTFVEHQIVVDAKLFVWLSQSGARLQAPNCVVIINLY